MKRASSKSSQRSSSGRGRAQPDASTTATGEARLCELELRLTQSESENRRLRTDYERLEIASANYAKLYDLAPIGLVTLDLRGRILSINHTGAALLGQNQVELLNRHFKSLIAPPDVSQFSAHLRECQRSHQTVSQELHLRRSSGQLLHVQLSTVAVLDEASHVTQLEMTFVDLTERKQSEQAIRAKEAQLRTISDITPVMLTQCSRDLRYKFVNPAYADFLELSPEQIVGRPIEKVLGKEAFETIRPYVERVLQGESVEYESEVPFREIGRRFIRVAYRPDQDAHGNVLGWVAAITDITERKQTEAATELASRLPSENPAPVVRLNAGRTLTYSNPAAQKILADWERAVPGEIVETAVDCLVTGVKRDLEWVFDGLVYDITFAPIPAGDYVNLYFSDITKRKRAENSLRESEDRFRILASHAPVGIFMSHLDGNAIYVNETWCTIAGLKPEQALGKGWLKAVHPEDRQRIEAGWEGAVTHRDSSTTEFRFLRPVNMVTWVLGNAVLLRNADGTPLGYVGTIADITVRKQAEETLRESRDELEARVRGRTLLLTKTNQRLEAEIAERKLVEASLRESEERFRLLVTGVHDYAIYMLDAEGRVASWNAGAERIKGYRAKEIMGRHFSRFFPREDIRSGQPQRLLRIAAKAGHVAEEGWRIRKDGSRFWAQAVITALRDDHGRLRGFSKVTHDITEHRRVQEALRESESRLRAILDNSPAIIFLKDRRGRYLHFNREFEKVFKAPLAKNAGKTDAEIFPPEQAAIFQANDQKVLRSGVSQVFDEVAMHDDGSHSSIVVKYPLRTADGEIYAVGGIVTDITQRRRAEEALRLNEKNLADFFEQAPLGLLWVSPEGDIVRVNKAQLELLGGTAKHCLGRRLSRFFSDPELINEALAQLARHEKLQNYRARLRQKDGSVRHVLIDANGLWRKDKFLYSRWFIRDITHRVELEKEILAISEREQQRLGHDLHDDLCQQLSGIEFLSETLASQLAGNARIEAGRAREIAGLIRQAIHHTRELARGLSPVRLVEDGLMLALRELADRTERLFHITCNFQCRTPVLINDETVGIHLYRIAQEAVSNAIKHGKARRIDIGLTRQNGDIVLAVSDNGVGFPVKLRKRKGMGLRVMQYRSSVLGGSLVVQRRVNGGTSVVCTVKNSLSRFRQKGKVK